MKPSHSSPPKFRIPRKKKKLIPKGVYCYSYVGGISTKEKEYNGYKVKTCPFYSIIKYKDIPINQRPTWMSEEFISKNGEEAEGWCKLIKTDIDDQCKSCSTKMYFLKQIG